MLGSIHDHADLTNEDINTETLHTMALKVHQRTLSQASMASAYEQILQSLAGDCKATAQFLSCGGPGQGFFLHFHPELHARGRTMKRQLSQPDYALGFRWEITSTHCHKIFDDTTCGAELHETQTHALIWPLQGSTVHRHNRIRDTITHILRESGQHNDVQTEQAVPEASDALRCATNGHQCSRTTGPTRPH